MPIPAAAATAVPAPGEDASHQTPPAGGRGTIREIAQALFVTEKTVETHLVHVYTKLGVSPRKQLPADPERG